MTSLFLYTFYVGFGLTLVSVILGVVDLGGHAGDLSHGGHIGHGHAGHLGHGHGGDLSHGHGGDTGHGHAMGEIATISPINFQTIVAALMGFGGVGYLLSIRAAGLLLVALLSATAGGFLTAWLIFRFQRFLVRGERPLGPTSYTGIPGRLTVSIREGGTGEVVYTQLDSRMVSAARSADGKPIAKGEEVVILRYEKGVAYVQLWREFMDQKSE